MHIIHFLVTILSTFFKSRPFGYSAGYSDGKPVFRKGGGDRGQKCEWTVNGFFKTPS